MVVDCICMLCFGCLLRKKKSLINPLLPVFWDAQLTGFCIQLVKDWATAVQRLSLTPAVAQHSNKAPISTIQGLASSIFLGLTLSCFNFISVVLKRRKEGRGAVTKKKKSKVTWLMIGRKKTNFYWVASRQKWDRLKWPLFRRIRSVKDEVKGVFD